ncbi:helix-turn-helix domain-containing protein, partial [Micrococcus luteus]|uniref:helix-turn-helix domain-containing protein n=1 Tax=Micrococcus luteus TaxID=1270 RepID=UPI001E3AC852
MAHLSDRQKAELVRQHQDGVPWTRIAEHSGVAVRTLQRWAARMEMGQLSRAPRSDKGSTRVNAELVGLLKVRLTLRVWWFRPLSSASRWSQTRPVSSFQGRAAGVGG